MIIGCAQRRKEAGYSSPLNSSVSPANILLKALVRDACTLLVQALAHVVTLPGHLSISNAMVLIIAQQGAETAQ
jgi:hypothetical protein